MRNLHLIIIAFTLSSCTFNNVEIKGTLQSSDVGTATIFDLLGNTVFNSIIRNGQFIIKQQRLPNKGYYTLSIQTGGYPRDFDIYLEPGKYVIEVPEQDGAYLLVKTQSTTQQSLSAYYDLENAISQKVKQENAIWTAKMKDPQNEHLTDAEFNVIMDHVEAGRRREHGLHIAALDAFIKKYPENSIAPHLISNMDYKADAAPYLMLYNKLSAKAQNSAEGKLIGQQLRELAR